MFPPGGVAHLFVAGAVAALVAGVAAVERKVEVVTGVNLPMVLKAISLRQNPLPMGEMAAELAESARKAIGHASLELRKAMR